MLTGDRVPDFEYVAAHTTPAPMLAATSTAAGSHSAPATPPDTSPPAIETLICDSWISEDF